MHPYCVSVRTSSPQFVFRYSSFLAGYPEHGDFVLNISIHNLLLIRFLFLMRGCITLLCLRASSTEVAAAGGTGSAAEIGTGTVMGILATGTSATTDGVDSAMDSATLVPVGIAGKWDI